MNNPRNPENGQFMSPNQEPIDVEQLGREDRQAYQDGKAARDKEIEQAELDAQATRHSEQLQQSLLQAASVAGTETLAPVLYGLGLTIESEDNTLVMSNDEEQLYSIPTTEMSTLQKMQALDQICTKLNKQGSAGQEAAKRIQMSVQAANNNVIF